MKFFSIAAVLFVLALQPACERHPASQTVKGYTEKKALREEQADKAAHTPQTVNPDAPRFFPQTNQ